MGCSDFNSCAGVKLLDGTTYVCEIQLNHIDMLAAKKGRRTSLSRRSARSCQLSARAQRMMPGSSRL